MQDADPNIISYLACLQEAQMSWDVLTGGSDLASGPYEPSLIATLSQMLFTLMTDTDSPILATAKMQVWRC